MRTNTATSLPLKRQALFVLVVLGLSFIQLGQAMAASDYSIEMVLEKPSVRVNEEVKLEIRLTASLRRSRRFRSQFYKGLTPPSFRNFKVVDRSESTQRSINIVGRQYRQTYTHVITYLLRPLKQGNITISPAKATFGRKVMRSRGVLLRVLPPKSASSPPRKPNPCSRIRRRRLHSGVR